MIGDGGAFAAVGGLWCTDLRDLSTDPSCLDSHGFWVAVVEFEGPAVYARFDRVRRAPVPAGAPWRGPDPGAWASSLSEAEYLRAVGYIRQRIAEGEVYQANVCRVLSAPLPPGTGDLAPLARVLAAGNPAPHAALVHLPRAGVRLASASPELYLRRVGDTLESSPIKGTGRTVADLLDKDVAENIMIVDLVRNDLSRVARTGSVSVPSLLATQAHPGLVHLVSTVRARLRTGTGWAQVLAATFPPGSVTGAPKSSALRLIREVEPVPRGPYCGAVGYVDADRGTGVLAVGIRTFWAVADRLFFGTGAGITWGSDPAGEWAETQLKAARLVALASSPTYRPTTALAGRAR